METKQFRKLSYKELDVTYGGWQWLIALIPLVIQSITTAIVTIKSFQSSKGSMKTKNFDAKWEISKPKSTKSVVKQMVFYAY